MAKLKIKNLNPGGTVRLKIPTLTNDLIKLHKTDGDFAAISKAVFGDNTQRQIIKAAVDNGEGKERIVKAIVSFYNKKATVVKSLS